MGLLDRIVPSDWMESEWVRSMSNLFGHRRRRVWRRDSRLHVEFREIETEDFRAFSVDLRESLARMDGIFDLIVNGATGRAIVICEEWVDEEDVVQEFQYVEERHDYGTADFARSRIHYPADPEPITRKAVHLAADAIGVGTGTALKMLGFQPPRAGFDLAAAMSMVENTPHLRQLLGSQIGDEGLEVGFGAVNALIQAVGSGPIGPAMDLLLHVVKIRGALARRRVWSERESEICGLSAEGIEERETFEERPMELPDGPIEEYSEDALQTSLGGFLIGIADTRNLEAATSPLLGGLPKAARYGRESFLSELIRVLGDRDILALRPEVLERMDRIDTVVVDASLMFTGELLLGRVVPCGSPSKEEVHERLAELFDIEEPLRTSSRGDWKLGPLGEMDIELDSDIQKTADELGSTHAPVLTLVEGDTPIALIQTRQGTDPGAEPLLQSIRSAGYRLVIATDDRAAGESLGPDEMISLRNASRDIRQLQREGGVVAMIGLGGKRALGVSDLGIAFCTVETEPPWSADLVCLDSLDGASLIVEACEVARKVSEQSVTLAGTGAAIGMFVALGGLEKTDPGHVMHAVNAASLVALANGLRHAANLEKKPRPAQRDMTPWHMMAVDDVLERVDSSREGLSADEVEARGRQPEEPPSRPVRVAKAVAKELANPFTPILVAGAGLSAFVGSMADAGLVGAVIALNAAIGGVERFQAEEAVESLEKRESQSVRVRRPSGWSEVDESDLVSGDIIELEAGDVVPADCRIIEAKDLEIDESSLTGESLPVSKDSRPSFAAAIAERGSMIYDSTSIAAGEVTAVVVAVGDETEVRRGVLSGRSKPPDTGVESRLEELTEMTLPVAGFSGALLMGAGLSRGLDMNKLLDAGVGMTVAAVPEGLPILSTIAQLAAARRLSRRGALVRNPRAVEALGRLDVLCADKTGTLTEGKLRLHSVSDGRRFAECGGSLEAWESRVLTASLRSSPPPQDERSLPHPTDRAVVQGARDLDVRPTDGVERWERVSELPFEPGRSYHAVLARVSERALLSVKGAPEVVLPRCVARTLDDGDRPFGDEDQTNLVEKAEELAGRGLRVLVVAEREFGKRKQSLNDDDVAELTFRGFICLSDPVRSTSRKSIERLNEAGIEVIMITGDHPRTAHRIAEELALITENGVLTGAELDRLTDEELDDALSDIRVIARATPAHKVRIVESLQRAGRVVGMTGDGANDASAIRLADVGIALGEDATSAARDAADLVVVDENIETIVEAIAEGRAMWSSVRDAVSVLIGGNLGEIGFTLASGLIQATPTLNARQLLLVNLLTDVAPSLAIALRPPEAEVREKLMVGGPEETLGEALDRDIIRRALTTGSGALGAWGLARVLPGGKKKASTVALLSVVGTQLAQTLMVGKPTKSTVAASLGSAAFMLALVETPGVSQLFGCRPIGPVGLGIATGSSTLAAGISAYGGDVRKNIREYLQDAVDALEKEGSEEPFGQSTASGASP